MLDWFLFLTLLGEILGKTCIETVNRHGRCALTVL